jgi:hypothetical protein
MRNRAGKTLALAATLAAVAAAPAPATVVEKGHITDGEYGFGYDCGFPVDVTGVGSGNFRLREGKGDDASAFFSLDRISFFEVHTNRETGEWFTIRGNFVELDVRATHLGGSLFEFESVKAGRVSIIEDAQGNLVARDRGALRRTIVFDTGGDDRPGGTLVEVVDVRLSGPHPRFDAGLCAIATELIGS